MPRAKVELRQECVRLRTQERMSLREIHEVTGASKGSLSNWLRPHPLTKEEKRQRYLGKPGTHKTEVEQRPSTFFQQLPKIDYTTDQKGRIAEAAVLLRLLIHGYEVYDSVCGNGRIDWVVFDVATGDLRKIQVKFASRGRHGAPVTSVVRPQRKPYRRSDFDVLVGYDLIADVAYVYTWEEVRHLKNGVSATPDATEAWHKLRRSVA